MKRTKKGIGVSVCFCIVLACPAMAGTVLQATAIDSGGQRASSASYRNDGSIGGIGGVSSNAGGGQTVKSGYVGQLTDVTNLTVTATPGTVNEGGTSQLNGLAGLDDATVVVVEGSNIVWRAPVYPIAAVGSAGVATAAQVYADASATATGNYLAVSGSGLLLVVDSNPDNWGLYAIDQIPDWWQCRYFGTNDPLGRASATNVTGQNNLYAYIADLVPTNPAAAFEIVAVSNHPPSRVVYFLPASTARVYGLQYSTNLLSGSWTNLTPLTNWGSGGLSWLSDTNAASPRFYRIGVQVP